MDDEETRRRRMRLAELINEAFCGEQARLLAHIRERTGKQPNQGEISGLIKLDNSARSFGDKKARTLTEQIGLHRRWFDFPLGSNLTREQWLHDSPVAPLLPSPNSTIERPAAYSPPTTGGAMKSNVIRIRDSGDRADAGYVRLEHLSVQPRMGMGATVTEPVHLVRHLDVLEGWLRDEVGSIDARRVKVLTAVGRSMLPTIKDRDLVFVDVAHRHFDAPGIYVLDVAGRLLLKKVMIKADGTLVIRSDNTAEFPDEETYRLDQAANDVTLCGKVLAWWTLRKG